MTNIDLKNKLLNFQSQPPEGLWNKIINTLEDDTDYLFTEKMYHYEMAPPPEIWSKVTNALDEGLTPIVPFTQRYSRVLKYSGAIAVLMTGIILVGLFINKSAVSNEISLKQTPTGNSKTPTTPNTSSGINSGNENNSTENSGYSFNKNRNDIAARNSPISLLPVTKSSSLLKIRGSMVVAHNKPVVQSEVVDRYIVFSKATGEAVKLSKKLFSLFACSDDDANCKQNIENVQQKMASPAMMASADFTGVLEVLQSMDNQ